MAQDFYSTLGVHKNASSEEIKKAYRRLAHQHHPDKGGVDAEKFKQVNEAYQVLSNPDKRRQYDQFGQVFDRGQGNSYGGSAAPGWDFSDFAQGFGFDVGGFSAKGGSAFGGEDAFDIFSDIFGTQRRTPRRKRGVDLEMSMDLTFEEAAFGVEREITLEKKDACHRCSGSGAEPGSKVITCPRCHGAGQIRAYKRTILGQMSTVSTCPECEGSGKIPERACAECKGTGHMRKTKTLRIKIPAGVEDGSRIRVSNEGEAGYKGSNFGDLYLRLSVAPHKFLKREGETIFSEIPISFYQAALGAEIEVETIDGKVEVKIPAGTQSGKVLRLKGRGAYALGTNRRGDHMVTIRVVTPTKLKRSEKELFKKLAEENGESVNIDESFWSKFS